MVAKLKTKPKATKRSASLALHSSKRKKFQHKILNKHNGRASEETFDAQEISSGDEFEDQRSTGEAEGMSERSSSGEYGGSDSEAEDADHFSPVSNSRGRERDFDSDENMNEDGGSDSEAEDADYMSPVSTFRGQERDFDSDENMNDEQHDIEDLLYAVRDEELEALDKEYKELQAQEVDMLRNLKGRNDEEVLKGQAVRSQKALWDKALEARILLQRPFSKANRLPPGDIQMVMRHSSKDVESAFAKLNTTSTNTLHCLHETAKVLLNQVDSMSKFSDTKPACQGDDELGVLNDLDTIWQQISASYARFVPFRNSSVDRWQRKTQLSSGAAASKTKLRAFNQSISQQIESYMRDYSRILQRMCLRRFSVNVIGVPAVQAEDPISNDNRNVLEEGRKDLNGDAELIDDTEFYQELLREFIESSDPSSLGAMYPPVRNLRTKHRKVVDRRASKGRKIRYNVHDKIVNFMVPIPTNMPPMAEKLFSAGLFQGGATRPFV